MYSKGFDRWRKKNKIDQNTFGNQYGYFLKLL